MRTSLASSLRAFAVGVAFVGCGNTDSSRATPNGGDASSAEDAATDAAVAPGTGREAGNCSPCASGLVCDPADSQCKPDGQSSHIGAPCPVTGPDPVNCGTLPTATCNDKTNDGMPDGYCSAEPCTTAELCPVGSSCGALNGESPACFKNCATDADCRTPDYSCQPMDQLFVSGASRTVCNVAKPMCATPKDCPASLPKCTNHECTK